MSQHPGWPPPPGWSTPPAPGWPPPPPRRFATKWIWVGVAVGVVVTIGLPALLLLVAAQLPATPLRSIAVGLGVLSPIAGGAALAAVPGPPSRRGFGLGVIIGWALAPIVFAGVCLIVVIGAYSTLQS